MQLLRKMYFKVWKVPILKNFAYFFQGQYSKWIRLKVKIFGLNDLETIYDDKFYQFSKEEVTKFVPNFVDVVCTHLNPQSVIDIGCGMGLYVKEFNLREIKVVGYDGSPHALKNSVAKNGLVKQHDLRKTFVPDESYDLAICIEVAEHIPTDLSDNLLDTLTNSSNVILFTAAQKGQGGTDHINEQTPQFWLDKFLKRNFVFDKSLTHKLVWEMKSKEIPWWIYDNLMIFRKN